MLFTHHKDYSQCPTSRYILYWQVSIVYIRQKGKLDCVYTNCKPKKALSMSLPFWISMLITSVVMKLFTYWSAQVRLLCSLSFLSLFFSCTDWFAKLNGQSEFFLLLKTPTQTDSDSTCSICQKAVYGVRLFRRCIFDPSFRIF